MLKTKIIDCLKKAAKESTPIEIFVPENEKFGHYATNVALRLAKLQGKNPMEIAESIKYQISSIKPEIFEKIEVAPPGFINFWLSEKALQNELKEILDKKEKYGSLKIGKNKKINIEFISANPTGALTIGNGRGGFWGDVMANILKLSGYKVEKEYYVNDAKSSTQITELGKTGLEKGATYLTVDLKSKISKLKLKIDRLKLKDNAFGEVGYLLANEIHKENKNFIEKKLKIKFDKWFSEQSLYDSKLVDKLLADLKKKGLVYEKDRAQWFKATQFGDSEDRVLVRSARSMGYENEPTYFLPDLAYHFNKFRVRKFDKAIDVWGADHHGYIPRLKAGLKAIGIDDSKLIVVINQLVRLIKNGEEVKMSKRTGEFITLEELIKEVGLDAARFFFLMSSPDTHMDFDLDLAKEKSLKNPVYYVQYAAVRCQSVLRKSKIKNPKSKINFELLNTPEDVNLMRVLIRFPEIIEAAAENYNPQALIRYALNLAKEFHNFYEKERIIGKDKNLMLTRLEILKAARIIFQNIFNLIGISFSKRM